MYSIGLLCDEDLLQPCRIVDRRAVGTIVRTPALAAHESALSYHSAHNKHVPVVQEFLNIVCGDGDRRSGGYA